MAPQNRRLRDSASQSSAGSTSAKQSEGPPVSATVELLISLVSVPAIVWLDYFLGSSQWLFSEVEGRCHIIVRFVLWTITEGVLQSAWAVLLLRPSRWLARCMPNSSLSTTLEGLRTEENNQHDPAIQWPPADKLAQLPADWVVDNTKANSTTSKKVKQPYFLNHVRGDVRCRQAVVRIALAFATISQLYIMSTFVDKQPLSTVFGPNPFVPFDLFFGFFVGAAIVTFIFVIEVALGWLRIISFFEVAVPGESLVANLLCDVFFHIGVAVNEEFTIRGWMLFNFSHAITLHLNGALSSTTAIVIAVVLQSLLFAYNHVGSPGATRAGLMNLVIGGVTAGINVIVTGGLSFALGWHFGWNIFMGHLLGLSTSGIPMSAKIISVIPHPSKAKLHGGRFGPEQSPLASVAYGLGVVMLLSVYGWENRLTTV